MTLTSADTAVMSSETSGAVSTTKDDAVQAMLAAIAARPHGIRGLRVHHDTKTGTLRFHAGRRVTGYVVAHVLFSVLTPEEAAAMPDHFVVFESGVAADSDGGGACSCIQTKDRQHSIRCAQFDVGLLPVPPSTKTSAPVPSAPAPSADELAKAGEMLLEERKAARARERMLEDTVLVHFKALGVDLLPDGEERPPGRLSFPPLSVVTDLAQTMHWALFKLSPPPELPRCVPMWPPPLDDAARGPTGRTALASTLPPGWFESLALRPAIHVAGEAARVHLVNNLWMFVDVHIARLHFQNHQKILQTEMRAASLSATPLAQIAVFAPFGQGSAIRLTGPTSRDGTQCEIARVCAFTGATDRLVMPLLGDWMTLSGESGSGTGVLLQEEWPFIPGVPAVADERLLIEIVQDASTDAITDVSTDASAGASTDVDTSARAKEGDAGANDVVHPVAIVTWSPNIMMVGSSTRAIWRLSRDLK